MALVLLIEDDPGIRTALARALDALGHAVRTEPSGMRGLQRVLDEPPDIVLLDLGLPDVDGLQVLRMLRPISQVPVIVVTARDEDAATVAALDAGADDYVVKPFSADQIEARLRAVLRRVLAASTASTTVTVGALVLDLRSRLATLDGQGIELRPREFDLLAYLAQRPGEVVTKRTLLTEVWQSPYGGADKTVDVHLSWLRRKLGETAAEPRLLHTVRGVGVKLLPVQRR